MSGFWPVVGNVIRNSDILLLVLDARMPEISRNKELEAKIERFEKPMFRVMTKMDLLSGPEIEKLRGKYPDAFFVSGTENTGFKRLKTGIMIEGKRMGLKTVRVGVVGYPNMGKSAIINCLAKGARTKVSNVAGTTRGTQWVRVGDLRIIDSPGVIPFSDRDERKLGLLVAKNPEKLRNPEETAKEILSFLLDKSPEGVKKYFKVTLESNNPHELFEEIMKQRHYFLKGGVLDEHRAALDIIREWQNGKLNIKTY